MILSQPYNIYVSSCTESGGIYHFKSDGNGSIELKNKYNLDRPMYIIADDNILYCLMREAFEDGTSGLVSYEIAKDGSLKERSMPQSTKGVCACHLCKAGENVYCVNYLSGSVIKMPDTMAVHSGKGKDEKRQEAPHTHFVSPSPDGEYIFVTDLGLDKIFVYDKNLNEVSKVSVPEGHGPRHLAFGPDGKTVYCANELKSTVSVLEYSNGRLELKNTYGILPKDFKGESTAAAIRYCGGKIFVSNRGHNSISVLAEQSGILKPEQTIPSGGADPRDFWVDDEVLICTNQTGNNVTVISRKDESLLFEFKIDAPISVYCTKG